MGQRDDFELDLKTDGPRVCGFYELTAQIDNHVDDGGLDDWLFTPTTARSVYRVHFYFSGSTGDAVIRVKGRKLYWKVVDEDRATDWESWLFTPPNTAVLTRLPPAQVRQPPHCGE
jgi:hypothetical protein